MKKLLLLTLLILPNLAIANGGPVDWTLLLKTGNVEFINKSGFQIEKEHIDFEIDGDYTNVSVNYVITNNNDKESVTYAFPIDIFSKDGTYSNDVLKDEIPFFEISDNGQNLNFNISDETETIEYPYPEIYDIRKNTDLNAIRIFYTTQISFDRNETKSIVVKYRAKNQYLNLVFTKSIIPSYTDRMFFYNLEPSKNWGNGIVKDFSYTIDFSQLSEIGGTVKALPPGGEYDNYIFTFTSNNMDLNRNTEIFFTYDIKDYLKSQFYHEQLIPNSSIKSISTSSTLPRGRTWTYNAENLIDKNYQTVWVEAASDSGIGETIEIELENFSIGYIGIVNGFNHSREFYNNNSRALKIKYELYLDEDGPYNWFSKDVIEGQSDIKDLGFNVINANNISKYAQRIASFGEVGVPTTKIRLTILNAIDGEKYQDLCISEIVILGYTYEELE